MTNDMSRGNPARLIISFMLPVLAGNIFQQFYNVVDSVIVGQFLGVNAPGCRRLDGKRSIFGLGTGNRPYQRIFRNPGPAVWSRETKKDCAAMKERRCGCAG